MVDLKTCMDPVGSSPCGKPVLAKGLCAAHYQRQRRLKPKGKQPIRRRKKGDARLVQLPPVRVDPEIARLLKAEADNWGITLYRRIVDLLGKEEEARRYRVRMEPRQRG